MSAHPVFGHGPRQVAVPFAVPETMRAVTCHEQIDRGPRLAREAAGPGGGASERRCGRVQAIPADPVQSVLADGNGEDGRVGDARDEFDLHDGTLAG